MDLDIIIRCLIGYVSLVAALTGVVARFSKRGSKLTSATSVLYWGFLWWVPLIRAIYRITRVHGLVCRVKHLLSAPSRKREAQRAELRAAQAEMDRQRINAAVDIKFGPGTHLLSFERRQQVMELGLNRLHREYRSLVATAKRTKTAEERTQALLAEQRKAEEYNSAHAVAKSAGHNNLPSLTQLLNQSVRRIQRRAS